MGNGEFNRRRFGAGLIAAAGIGVAGQGAALTPLMPCPPDRARITGPFGSASFTVDVVDTDASRARGLMHVPSMPLSYGMLFIYQQPQRMSFWMRNTLIELDMLFIDETGVIRHIHHRARPLDETPISGGSELLTAVLEINGGLAKRLGITKGDLLRHPAFAGQLGTGSCP